MAGKDAKRMEVTLEDQQNINAFNKMNSKKHELESFVKAKKKILEDLEDASNELMLSDEENIRYVIGECMVHMEKEQAEDRLQTYIDMVNGELSEHQTEMEGIQEKMKELKALLYGKFGTSINLEE